MAERRSLTEGLKATPAVDPAVAREFIHAGKMPTTGPTLAPPPDKAAPPVNRAPISTRIRADYAAALKRASLERQLKGIEPNTLQDILEQAIEPWLRSNGYLS
ncbi:MAG: hypothetical protein HUU22_02080 [Phycisphaerae bacterium]|nr:hypothetical protein [Phycisphaerae bacterium]NUQ44803.1 hypothetical protein [Phycisphaerae bacterium]